MFKSFELLKAKVNGLSALLTVFKLFNYFELSSLGSGTRGGGLYNIYSFNLNVNPLICFD